MAPARTAVAEASWREHPPADTVSFHDAMRLKTLFGRMPESGKVTLKAQLASEVAIRPRTSGRRGSPTPPPTIGCPSWRPCRPTTEVIDFWHGAISERRRPCGGLRLVREVPEAFCVSVRAGSGEIGELAQAQRIAVAPNHALPWSAWSRPNKTRVKRSGCAGASPADLCDLPRGLASTGHGRPSRNRQSTCSSGNRCLQCSPEISPAVSF